MVWVPRWRIGRPRHRHSIGSRQGPEVIVEGMILLDDDYHLVDFAGARPTRRLRHRKHVRFERNQSESNLRLFSSVNLSSDASLTFMAGSGSYRFVVGCQVCLAALCSDTGRVGTTGSVQEDGQRVHTDRSSKRRILVEKAFTPLLRPARPV